MPLLLCSETLGSGHCGSNYPTSADNTYTGTGRYNSEVIDANIDSLPYRDTGCRDSTDSKATCNRDEIPITERGPDCVSSDNILGGIFGNLVQVSGEYCVRKPADRVACPDVGNLTGASWNGTETGNGITCSYSTISTDVMFDDGRMADIFSEETIKTIRNDYCKNNETVDSDECKTWLDDKNRSGTSYNETKMQLCQARSDWNTDVTCRTAIQSTLKDPNSGGIVSTAVNMVRSFCDANPTSPDCSCYNVTKYASTCFTTNRDKPGCSDLISSTEYEALNAKLNEFQAKIIAKQPFCLSDSCATASTNTDVLLPTAPISCPININACFQDYTSANLINSQVRAECRNAITVVDSAGNPIGGSGGDDGDSASPVSQGFQLTTTNILIIGGILLAFLFLVVVLVIAT